MQVKVMKWEINNKILEENKIRFEIKIDKWKQSENVSLIGIYRVKSLTQPQYPWRRRLLWHTSTPSTVVSSPWLRYTVDISKSQTVSFCGDE